MEQETLRENYIEVVIKNHQPQLKKGKVFPFFIYLESNDLIIHNCVVDIGTMHNIIPLSIIKNIGIDCTRHYKDGESIFVIDSRSMVAYGDINWP